MPIKRVKYFATQCNVFNTIILLKNDLLCFYDGDDDDDCDDAGGWNDVSVYRMLVSRETIRIFCSNYLDRIVSCRNLFHTVLSQKPRSVSHIFWGS